MAAAGGAAAVAAATSAKVGMSMDFGNGGRVRTAGLLLALMALFAGAAGAQEPPPAGCELPLIVPEASEVEVELQPNARGAGVLVTWPQPPDSLSTCYALTDTAGLGVPIEVTGDYADRFDRTFEFDFITPGRIGDAATDRVVCTWTNANNVRTGRIGGEINLSNTGGVWQRDAGGTWSQINGGLPPYLPYTNIVDLARSGDGTLLLALSSGAQFQNDPRGLYRRTAGGAWQRAAAEPFGRDRRVRRLAMSPTQSSRFAVGTDAEGLFVTSDGGETFTQWTSSLDPGFESIPSRFEVTALLWTETRLAVAVRNYGLFVSTDDGSSFTRLGSLTVPDGNGGQQVPYIRSLAEDPGNADRILVGLTGQGIYETQDAGQTWTPLDGDFIGLPDDDPDDDPAPDSPKTVISLYVDPDDSDHLLMGTLAQGIWWTTDRGVTWNEADTPFISETEFTTKPQVTDMIPHDGRLVALAVGRSVAGDRVGLIDSDDGGQTWTLDAGQPANRSGRRLISADGVLYRPTYGGGIYQPGTAVAITETILPSATDAEFRQLEFGLSISFGEGEVELEDADEDGTLDSLPFNVVAQDYQGWIVWRSERGDPDNMAMIGRYDKNNPESCIEGFCGDDNFALLPNCFSERRAACFDFSTPGQVSFYDGDVFNGFTYYYAVTTFDYGNISLVFDPRGLASPLVFPARYADDPQAEGPGNRQSFQVNLEAEPAEDGEEIYVYPNPLRLEAGISGGEGEEVIWTNLPPESQVQVFTIAGDKVADLPEPDQPQRGSNIYWVARNDDERLLASGIYIWRVIMPQRGDYWGKLVIIR